MRNAQLVAELGLREAERFAIAGTLTDFFKRVEQLAELGVRQIRLSVAGRDHARLIQTVGKESFPVSTTRAV